jgi:hypothetical protein
MDADEGLQEGGSVEEEARRASGGRCRSKRQRGRNTVTGNQAVDVRLEGVTYRPPGPLDTNTSSTQTQVDGPTRDVDEEDGQVDR